MKEDNLISNGNEYFSEGKSFYNSKDINELFSDDYKSVTSIKKSSKKQESKKIVAFISTFIVGLVIILSGVFNNVNVCVNTLESGVNFVDYDFEIQNKKQKKLFLRISNSDYYYEEEIKEQNISGRISSLSSNSIYSFEIVLLQSNKDTIIFQKNIRTKEKGSYDNK